MEMPLSQRAAFALMLNDLTGVPGLCEKKPRKQKSRIGSLKWPKTLTNSFPPGVAKKGAVKSLIRCAELQSIYIYIY